jgi:hypothetical protein
MKIYFNFYIKFDKNMWFLNMDKYKSQAIEVFLFNFVYK